MSIVGWEQRCQELDGSGLLGVSIYGGAVGIREVSDTMVRGLEESAELKLDTLWALSNVK